MIRRLGEPVVAGQRYRLRPGAYAALCRDGKVLLTHQSNPHPEFQLPGGGIEPGEQVLPALHREVFEETGWSIGGPRRLGAFRRFVYMPDYDIWAEKLCTVYAARPLRRLAAPSEPGHSAVWMEPAKALACLGNDGDRIYLARALNGAGWR